MDNADAANIIPTKIHIRESGNYAGGTTLSTSELVTVDDGSTISFALTASHFAAVTGLITPELTIEPGAVQDASGNLIDGTFDASTRSFVDATRIRGKENSPQDIAFSNDGTKMFIVGIAGDDVNEYSLSSPFDASTRSFVDATGIGGQDTFPVGIAFSNNGTKMFILGAIGNDVNEYSLSSPFDASTLSFVDDTGIGGQETNPRGIAFSNDGTKMFIVGTTGDDVNEYSLSSPFDASTLSFVDATGIGEQENEPQDIAFSNDGTKMFIVGIAGDDVNEYSLSSPFDASTLSFVDDTGIGGQENSPRSIAFSNDGTKMFIVGTTGDDVNEYDLHSVYPITVTGTPTLPAGAFVTTWSVTNADKTIKIPVGGQTGNYTVDWGDGTDSTTHVSDATHEYSTAGDYTVSISGDFKKIFLNGVRSSMSEIENAKLLLSIEQWGDMEWSSMMSAFSGASNMMYNAVDTPDLSNVKSMESMFHAARAFNGDLSSWNVSQVTNMDNMYQNADAFNGDISTWNVSKVTNMRAMFASADAFDQLLNRWNVSQVTNMDGMFSGTSFNQPLNRWDVSAVTSMNYMFSGASAFNQPLNNWNVSAVTDMSNMFNSASYFNGDISSWNVSAVTDMSNMFEGTSSFNGDISSWNVAAVTDTDYMFSGASFNGDISNWNVSAVTYMTGMFEGASSFNGDISSWNVSAVTGMSSMFEGASSFNGDISSWNVSAVTGMSSMFSGASFNGDISSWDVSAVTRMDGMFSGASTFNGDISSWDVSAVTRMDGMFSGASTFNGDISSWDVSAVIGMNDMFDGASTFNGDISSWNVSAVIGMNDMFGTDMFEQNLGKWYVVPEDTDYDAATETTLVVTAIAAQNSFLDDHSPNYAIGTGNDFALFNMTGNNLMFKSTPLSARVYTVNVTAPGGDFGTNNHHVFDITVTGEDNYSPDVTASGSADVYEGSVGRLTGTASDPDTGDTLTYAWTHNGTLSLGITIANNTALSTTFKVAGNVTTDTPVTFALTVNDGTSSQVTKTVGVNIQDSSGAFIATWETGATQKTVRFAVSGTNPVIDWGDGTERTVSAGEVSHTYAKAGEYRVIVDGSVDRLYHHVGEGSPELLRYVDQWGDTEWSNMQDMFHGASNMEYRATDTPDLSGVFSMHSMFFGASSFDDEISSWNVSSVTNMSSMFFGASSFNRTLNDWNVSSVLYMSSMFAQATSFNQSLNNWDVSGVTSMSSMFSYASSFNQTLNGWDVSKVTDMTNMFSGAEDFNQPLNNWDVSKVTNTDSMFEYASDFNGDISSWNVSAVTGMSYMLSDASSFNQTLNDWDVSKVTDMSYMFLGAKVFNQPLNGWNVSKVTNMYYMFSGAKVFNQPLNDWNVSKVTDMTNMFSGALSFEQNLGEWYILPAEAAYDITDASLNVTVISAQNSILDNHDPMYGIDPKGSHDSGLFNMTGNNLMFKSTPLSARVYTVNVTAPGGDFGTNNHHVFDITVTGEDNYSPDVTASGSADVYEGSVGRLTGTASDPDTGDTLTYAWTHNGTLSLGITIANNTALSTTFKVAGNVTTDTPVTFALTVNDGTSSQVTKTVGVNIQDSSGAFIATWETGATQKTVRFAVSGTNPVIDWGDGTERTVSAGEVSHTYAKAGEYRVIVDGSVDRLYHHVGEGSPELLRYVDQWGDTEWSNMQDMFHGASNMEYRATDTPDLSGVFSMHSMFFGASSFDDEISSWNVSSVTNMSSMFFGASSFNRTLNDWNVSSVLYMSSMFAQATSFNQSLNNWDVSGVTSMSSMFSYASSFNQTLNGWDVSKVTDMTNMFSGAEDFNQPLNNWDVSKVTNTDSMFEYASDFNGDISSWNVSAVTGMSYMLSDASSFNQTLNDWDVSKVTDMSYMFLGAKVFNQPLNGWNVSKVTNMYYMFSGAKVFNQPLNDWNVSKVTDMTNMFSGALSFEQNLGEWYILPAEAAYDITDASLNVTVISAQNSILDNHDPMYGIDPKGSHDSGLFNMTGNNLMFKSTPLSARVYTVNVTAPGGDFGTNNHHVFDITVTGEDNYSPDVTASGSADVYEGSVGRLTGTASDPDTGDTLTYAWTHNGTLSLGITIANNTALSTTFKVAGNVTTDTPVTFALTVNDGTSSQVTKTVGVNIQDSSGAFIATWETGATQKTVRFAVSGTNPVIDWGDGTERTVSAGEVSHTYAKAGEYRVIVDGSVDRLYHHVGEGSPELLRYVDQWGDTEWSNMQDMFHGASNMEYRATDTPDLSGVFSMHSMFFGASSFDDEISSWNVSSVTNMSSMFFDASSFNRTLNDWNVSSVLYMSSMFAQATSFNQSLNNWDVSGVTSMSSMFSYASSFNQTLNGWDVSKVTDMTNMFSGAEDFNQPLNNWDVSKVTNTDSMFEYASDFNGDISSWNVSAVTGMSYMLSDASSFNQTLNDWDVSKVTDMSYMFLGAKVFNQPLNGWNVSKVTNMYYMFSGAKVFNQPLNDWNVSKVTDMTNMFSGALSFEQNLGEWYILPAEAAYDITDASLNVTVISAQNSILDNHDPMYGIDPKGSHDSGLFNMTGNNLMFKSTPLSARVYTVNVTAPGGDFGTNNHHVFDITVTGEDNYSPDVTASGSADVYEGSVGRLTGTASDPDTGDTLTYAWTHNGTLSLGITIANNTALSTTFKVAGNVTTDTPVTFALTVNYGISPPVTDTVDVNIQDSSGAFIATWETGATQKTVRFAVSGTNPVIDWGDGTERTSSTGRVQHTYAKAGQYRVIVDGSVSELYHSAGTSTPELLRYVDQWGDIKWSNMQDMFHGALNMEYRATDTPDLSGVSRMDHMFYSTTSFNGDISGWDVSSVINMFAMFQGASSFNQSLNSWDVSAVTDMPYMFSNTFFNGDISGWDVSKVTNMNSMFFSASSFNQSLNSWNVSAVTDMNSMFDRATSFDQPLDSWNVSAVTDMYAMFRSTAFFDGDISGWDVSKVTDMSRMFSDASLFNQPLNSWNVSAVTDMTAMFNGASDFDGDISSWNVSAVTDMTRMFLDASLFNQPLNDWNVSAVTDMTAMFQDASKFNQPLNDWAVSAVTGMNFMFFRADDFEQNLGEWYVVPADTVYNTSDETSLVITTIAAQNSVLDGHSHYYSIGTGGNSTLFSMTGSNLVFKVTPSAETYKVNVTAPEGDFGTNNHRVLDITVEGQDDSTVSADAFLTTWNVAASQYTISIPVEVRTDGTLTIDWGDNAITPVATNGTQSHTYSASGEYQVSMTGDLSRIILSATGGTPSKLASIYQWGYIEWSSMEGAFRGASNMEYKAADAPDLSYVTSMQNMFRDASSFNGDISSWNVSAVTDMNRMFSGASTFNGDLSGWDVSAVTNMDGMFDAATSFDQNLGNWYVTLDPDTIAGTGIPGVVGTISAQNQPLKNHSPTYGIVAGYLNATHFEIVPGNQLNMTSGVPGEYSVNVTASGGTSVFESGNNWRVLVVRVSGDINVDPVLNTIGDQTVNEFVELTFTATASDDDALTFSLDGTVPLDAAITSAGVFTWTPTESQDGDHAITVQVTDGSLTDSETLTVTVNEVNVAPVLNAIGDKGTSELVELTFTATASDTDVVDNVVNTLTFSLDGTVPLDAVITSAGVFTWTPTESQVGPHDITVQVTDGSLTDSETLTVTVHDIAPLPVSARASSSFAIALTLSEVVTSGEQGPNGFSVTTGGDPVSVESITGSGTTTLTLNLDGTISASDGVVRLSYSDATGDVADENGNPLASFSDLDVLFPSQRRGGTTPPAVDLGTLAYQRSVDIPPHIAEQIASHDASEPLEPITPDGTFDFPLVINGYGYLLDDTTNTLVPQTVMTGDDSATHITFTVYTQKDLAYFTLYLNLSDENIDYADSDTYITYKDDGTTSVTDPHGYIGSATVTVTQEDDQIPEKRTVRITIEFGEEPMGPTNMVAYMWNTDRKALFVKIIDAIEVVAAPLEPVMQAADPEPLEPDSGLPADPEPVAPDFAGDAADPEPVPADTLWPDDYDEAQALNLIRMWSGFEPEMITDEQMLASLGLDYPDADIPDWMMTQLGVLVAKGDVTTDEFLLALQYVLTHA